MKHISKILAAALLAGTAVVASPAPSAQAADRSCMTGAKLWAQNTFGKGGSVIYARNWMGDSRRQPSYNGVTYMNGYHANGGAKNLDNERKPVRWGLRGGQYSKGYGCVNPTASYPNFHDVDGIWVPAGWWARIETLQSSDHRNPNKTWRYWKNLPGTSTGRWYKITSSQSMTHKFRMAWGWRG